MIFAYKSVSFIYSASLQIARSTLSFPQRQTKCIGKKKKKHNVKMSLEKLFLL